MKAPLSPPRVLCPLALLACLALPACQPPEEHAHQAHKAVVATSPVVKDVTLSQEYVCQIHSQRHITVQALESGYLEVIPIKEGQSVKAGDVMFQVNPTLYQARLEGKIAEANLAGLEYRNTKKLFDEGRVVSQQEVNIYQAKLTKAQAELKLAEAERNFATVRAPFDGVVDRFLQQQGSLVKEGDDLTTLSDNSTMWVYFNVPEARYLKYMSDLKKSGGGGRKGEEQIPLADLPAAARDAVLKKYPTCKLLDAESATEDGEVEYRVKVVTAGGTRLELGVSGDGKTIEEQTDGGTMIEKVGLVLADGTTFPQVGTNVMVEAEFNNETGNIKFRADFKNPRGLLRHGQTGNVVLSRVVKDALVIPQRATYEILDKRYVYVLDGGVVRQRLIEVAHEMEDVFVLRSGLAAGEKFVLEGIRQVHDGEAVEFEFRDPAAALKHQKFHAE